MKCPGTPELYIPKWARCCPDCPTEIQVLRKPNKTTYEVGETIDYTGIIVRGYKDGAPWSNSDYPSGIIPPQDLIFSQDTFTGYTPITVSFLCDVRVSTTFLLKDCPAEIRLTTLPKTVYEVDQEHQFPLPVDFSGAVVHAYYDDGTDYGDVTTDVTYSPTELTGGTEDEGAYYLFTGLDNWHVVNTQSDNTGGAVCGDVGARFCAIMVGTDMYIYGVSKSPFTMKSATWDGTEELHTYTGSSYAYGGEIYYVTSSTWYNPPPVPTIEYNVDNGQPRTQQAIDICYGGHVVVDETLITVSWTSPCGEELTTSYEVYVH